MRKKKKRKQTISAKVNSQIFKCTFLNYWFESYKVVGTSMIRAELIEPSGVPFDVPGVFFNKRKVGLPYQRSVTEYPKRAVFQSAGGQFIMYVIRFWIIRFHYCTGINTFKF